MYRDIDNIELKSGEVVEAGVVTAPDAEWRGRVLELLGHKPGDWRWQMETLLDQDAGIETRFYLAHRGGEAFANIMTIERAGVGLLGHVYTRPAARGQGAASRLMGLLLEDVRARGGQALYLGTGYDTPPYHIYHRHGFRGVEPESGVMTLFTSSRDAFERDYFAPGAVRVEALGWPHYPGASVLMAGDFPGVVRCAPLGLLGRTLVEGAFLPVLREHATGHAVRAHTLCKTENGAVVGLAAWGSDALWPGTCVVDVYCHPAFWGEAGELLANLEMPGTARAVAYCDAGHDAKMAALEAAGFRAAATLPAWVAADAAESGYVDVVVWERR